MKKLLVAGISTLSLMVAAPNAFGAAAPSSLYGSYNAKCEKYATTLNFYGIDGTTGSVRQLFTVNYNNGNFDSNFGANLNTLARIQSMPQKFFFDIGGEEFDLSGGLMPRAALFFSAGNSDPTKNAPAAAPTLENYGTTGTTTNGTEETFLVTKTSCSLSKMISNGIENTNITQDDIKKLTIVFQYSNTGGYVTPSIPGSDFTETLDKIIEEGNSNVINFIVAYAAACNTDPETTTCSVKINSNGGVQYTNSCKGGCFASEGSFGVGYAMCYDPEVFKMGVAQADMSNQNVALD